MAVQHERRAGEEAAGHVPALAAVEHRLVPRHRPGVGLVRIDQQAGGAVGRTRGGDRHAVGADRRLRLAFRRGVQVLQHPVQAIEERRLEHEAGGDVAAADRQKAGRDEVRMAGAIGVDPVGVGLQHPAQIRRQVAVIAGVHRRPHPQQPDDIVGHGALRPLLCGQGSARGQGDVLDGGEVVLGVGPGQAIGDVGVGRAGDVRHAEVVPPDARVIGAALGDQDRRVGGARLGQTVGDDDSAESENDGCGERPGADGDLPAQTHGPSPCARSSIRPYAASRVAAERLWRQQSAAARRIAPGWRRPRTLPIGGRSRRR